MKTFKICIDISYIWIRVHFGAVQGNLYEQKCMFIILPGRKIPLDTASKTRLNASPGGTGPKLLPIAFSHKSSMAHPDRGLKAAVRWHKSRMIRMVITQDVNWFARAWNWRKREINEKWNQKWIKNKCSDCIEPIRSIFVISCRFFQIQVFRSFQQKFKTIIFNVKHPHNPGCQLLSQTSRKHLVFWGRF